MERPVEEGERGALARTRQRGARAQLLPPFDVGRRKRPQRARDFRKREIRKVFSLKICDPPLELIAHRSPTMSCRTNAVPPLLSAEVSAASKADFDGGID